MMISVTERTREIGVRKALGATRGTTLAIPGRGGDAHKQRCGRGLGLGTLLALLIRSATPILASAVIAALGASALTGILFGMLRLPERYDWIQSKPYATSRVSARM